MLRACSSTDTPYRSVPLLHGVNIDASGNLTSLDADIASFLLMRGPWAWTGAGMWGMSWPTGRTWNSSNLPVSRPPQFDFDYGTPLDEHCFEAGAGSNIFFRRYTHRTPQLNCTAYTATLF